MPTRTGRIVAVCLNPDEGTRKFPQPRIQIGSHGIVGDHHNREMRPSFSKPGTFKPNTDRHITIVAQEAFDFINTELGTSVTAGDFGENLLVQGLDDLSWVPDGATIKIGDHIELKVAEQNEPCRNLAVYHRLMVKTAYKRRGLLCSIQSGQGEWIHPLDAIAIET
ncbi:MAG: MOSC domain-containing protein [Patescibacteria group bacterium]|nr:MOSC domain-containing protein [Patescibacteria group bacterium]MDE2058038.1 MOSC domain-containing protein [Patescibacteria group bacterium]